jgi:hypothetical protein
MPLFTLRRARSFSKAGYCLIEPESFLQPTMKTMKTPTALLALVFAALLCMQCIHATRNGKFRRVSSEQRITLIHQSSFTWLILQPEYYIF